MREGGVDERGRGLMREGLMREGLMREGGLRGVIRGGGG